MKGNCGCAAAAEGWQSMLNRNSTEETEPFTYGGRGQTGRAGVAAKLIALLALVLFVSFGQSVNVQAISQTERLANEAKVFNFFVNEMKFPPAAACGIMGTMHHESGFTPDIYGVGGAYGLCQWTGIRITRLQEFCAANGYDYRTVEGQLHFIKYELNTYAECKSLLEYLKKVPNTATGAYNAGYQWCYVFQMSSMGTSYAISCSQVRATTGSTVYWNKYGVSATYLSVSQVTGGLKITVTSNQKYGFVVKRKENGGSYVTVATLGATAKSWTDTSVSAGKTYSYQVIAKTANGAEGDGSNEVTVKMSRSLKDAACSVKLAKTSVTYTGKAITPVVTVTYNGKKLTKNTDYKLSYTGNVKVGTAKVTVSGQGSYKGSVTLTFTIKKAAQTIKAKNLAFAWKNATVKTGFTAKGKISLVSSNPSVASVSGTKLRLKSAGKTVVTVRAAATASYSAAQKKITVTVAPSRPVISSMKNTSAGAAVSWKGGGSPDGYEIQYTHASNFKSCVKTLNVKKGKTQAVLSNVTKGKTLRVRIRSYKVVGGKKVYSTFSATKALKIK